MPILDHTDLLASDSSTLSSIPSSPLSSLASRSPSPPAEYPSPVSSQATSLDTLAKRVCDAFEDSTTGEPPAKKRRITGPRPRTTRFLDVTGKCPLASQTAQLEILRTVLRKRKKIVVIVGAGISVSAGIPDFRSSTGLFSSLRAQHNLKSSGKNLFDASVYREDATTSSFHQMVRELSHLSKQAQPTQFHHLLARLSQEDRLLRLYSQNVDGIDVSLPPLATNVPLNDKAPWPRTVQLHGGLEKMVCSKCHHVSDFDGELFDGPEPPSCTACEAMDSVRTKMAGKRSHGIGKLRPRMVLYNEHNPDDEAIGAVTTADLRSRPDAVIVVGTSLKVPGVRRIVREMCGVVRGRRNGLAIWVNTGPLPSGKDFEDCWDLVVEGNSDTVAEIGKLPLWDSPETKPEEVETAEEALAAADAELLEKDAEKHKNDASTGFQVVVPAGVGKLQGMLTPTASPRPSSPKVEVGKISAFPPTPTPLAGKKKIVTLTKAGKPAKKPGPKPGWKKIIKDKPQQAPQGQNIGQMFGVTKKGHQPSKSAAVSKNILEKIVTTKIEQESVKVVIEEQTMQPVSPTEARSNNGKPLDSLDQMDETRSSKENQQLDKKASDRTQISPKAPTLALMLN